MGLEEGGGDSPKAIVFNDYDYDDVGQASGHHEQSAIDKRKPSHPRGGMV